MTSQSLAQQVGDRLRTRGLTLAVAESCTGGLLGDLITDVPGSSDYFLGGVLSYSNQVKQAVLGVRAETLASQGAVSAQCAAEMAQGARRLVQSDVALSVTGIAGPGGGTADKPVGTVCFAWAGPGVQLISQVQRFSGDRDAVRRQGVIAALEGVLVQLTAP